MLCQLCQQELQTTHKEGVTLYQCPQCAGFWVHKGALNQLIQHQAGDVEFSSIDHHFHSDDHSTLKCAFCDDSATIKCNFIGNSNVVLDYCETCGAFWVDDGEMDKMQRYIEQIGAPEQRTLTERIISILYALPR